MIKIKLKKKKLCNCKYVPCSYRNLVFFFLVLLYIVIEWKFNILT